MSQKASRRSRKSTTDSSDSNFKSPPIFDEPKVIVQESVSYNVEGEHKTDINGADSKDKSSMKTRSRSNTPLKKKKIDQDDEIFEKIVQEGILDEHNLHNGKNTTENIIVNENTDTENGEMDPLVLSSDEPDPELQFDEASETEGENGKESPFPGRCITRRSQNRNIPTPKTPKLIEENETKNSTSNEMEVDTPEISFDENITTDDSTNVEVGSDSTRINFINNEDNSTFLNDSKNKSFSETIKGLSSRKTIRPISEDYRKLVLKNNLNKSELNTSYPLRSSIERISLKRKSSSETFDGNNKRLKSDSVGFLSRLTSPIVNIRNRFKSDGLTSETTPTLTSYKDEHCLVEKDITEQKDEKRWCLIM